MKKNDNFWSWLWGSKEKRKIFVYSVVFSLWILFGGLAVGYGIALLIFPFVGEWILAVLPAVSCIVNTFLCISYFIGYRPNKKRKENLSHKPC